MSANEDFFTTRKAAAVLKHGILKRYPVIFASKTGQGNPVVFLDGYAGRGEYDDGKEAGSPLLLSRCADTVRDFRNVTLFFVEQNPDHFANLQQVLAAKGGTTQRFLRQGDVADHLPEVLTIARGASLFAFLDPFGLALDFDLVRSKLLGRASGRPTEVLLHFSVSAVARMGRAVQAARGRSGHLALDHQKTANHLTRFLGGDWWQEHFASVGRENDDERATDIALRVGAEYDKRLTAGSTFRAIAMPVRPRPELAPKYVLTLFTTHPDGAWHFVNALGQAGLDLEEEHYNSRMGPDTLFGGMTPFDRERHISATMPRISAIIERNIFRLLKESQQVRLADQVSEVYADVLGQAWERHARRAVKSLYKRGLIDHKGIGDFWKSPICRL
ncbi:three-Cys-motif partner protein TcmP [Micromonospora sp. NPDC051196]|uniref:three-Cys-motif partner protein TcmP n=1 Tax=Micromonospora sp. NPDC051196 TaxID=3155281 RepID=UPI0034494F60